MMNFLYLLSAAIDKGNLPEVNSNADTLQTIMQIFFGILGAFALLMIVISGFRYIISAGDPQKISTAKQGIIYALVGLVVAISAQAIIAFVLRNV